MNILKFLNSGSIAKHLEKIKYEFLPEEAMFLIHASRKATLGEKHAAYRLLIEQYPSYVLEEREHGVFKDQTIATFLSALIEKENQLVDECKKSDVDAIYSAAFFSGEDDCWNYPDLGYDSLYRSFQESVDGVLNEIGDDALKMIVSKKYLDRRRCVDLEILPDGTVLDVRCQDEANDLINAFDWMWIDIPTPFKRGDIVHLVGEKVWDGKWHSDDENAMVLTHLSTWGSTELKQNGYKNVPNPSQDGEENFKQRDKLKAYCKKHGDTSDMIAYGYSVGPHGDVSHDHTSSLLTYLDMEYYTGEISGSRRFLTALSSFLTGKVNLELLLSAYKIITHESNIQSTKSWLKNWFDEDTIKLLGLK